MCAYSKLYLDDVVESQGKLFDYIAQAYPECDTEAFIVAYMNSKTRESIDQGQAYTATMDALSLWEYFTQTENYTLLKGNAIEGFAPRWIGEFYAYYQWYYDIPSALVLDKVPVSFLLSAYVALSSIDLESAVKKVGFQL